MTWIISIIVAVLAAAAFILLAWWGLPILLVLGALFAVYAFASRRSGGPEAATIERGRTEPTGTVRKASGGAETANERVGQG
jgi:hypothetical protein